jgi:hypothetical protein
LAGAGAGAVELLQPLKTSADERSKLATKTNDFSRMELISQSDLK